jgi:hypothetical protein
MIPPTPSRDQLADELVLALVGAFAALGINVTYSSSSPDYIVGRIRQACCSMGFSTTELNQAVKRLRAAGKLISVPAGRYPNRTVRKCAQVNAQMDTLIVDTQKEG